MNKHFLYKLASVLMIVMLGLAALPVKTARAAATRFYLQNETSSVTTTDQGTWNYTTGVPTLVMSRTKSGTIDSRGVSENTNTNNYNVEILKFVSEPIVAQTIPAGSTLTWIIGAQESSSSANDYFRVHVYVVSNDGITVRGTLLDNDQMVLVEMVHYRTGRCAFIGQDSLRSYSSSK